MNTLTDRLLCFDENEFAVIANVSGIRSFYGFDYGEKGNFSAGKFGEENFHQGVFDLTKRGILTVQEDGFVLNQEIRELFEMIGQAEHVIGLSDLKGELPPMCLYCRGTGIAYAAVGTARDEYMRIGLRNTGIREFLLEEGRLPQIEKTEALESLRARIRPEGADRRDPEEFEDLEKIEGLSFLAVVRGKNPDEVKGRAGLVQTGLQEWLAVERGTEKTIQAYSRELFAETVESMIKT